ncbi:MAG: histidine phosphatase family protein [Candidatus Riflebacteria bacterium]|nr:histidine phosphatase family protein [Candidatus Riflebacteria bacterium]
MRLCIIRHGETTFNREERMQGARDIELTQRGINEAIELGKKLLQECLCPDCVYTSPVKRAYDTAINLNLNVPIISSVGLKARSLGILEGMTKSEINLKYPGYLEFLRHWNWFPPGSDECLKDVFLRAGRQIDEIVEKECNSKIAVVITHSGVLEALLRGWLSIEEGAPMPFPLKNAGGLIFKQNYNNWQPDGVIDVGEAGFVDYA